MHEITDILKLSGILYMPKTATISRTDEVPSTTVMLMINGYKETASILSVKGTGRPRETIERVERQLERTVSKDPFAHL